MSNEWMSAQNLERSHRVVAAINTISIHEKLKAAGVNDESRTDAVRKARSRLLEFLKTLEPIVQKAETDPESLVEDVDPRMGELARSLVDAKKRRPRSTTFADASPEEVSRLLESTDLADRERLLSCLRELRHLVEDHVHADIVKILGDQLA